MKSNLLKNIVKISGNTKKVREGFFDTAYSSI